MLTILPFNYCFINFALFENQNANPILLLAAATTAAACTVIDNLKNGRFHQHLRDTFAPLVVRYVDLMESSIAQSIHKGFEKERWESKGNGCATSEDLFWKLDALQSFIRDLHWPDEEFREHLEQRLKLMACDMIESCIQRTDGGFQSWLKKTVTFISTDYIIPSEMCAMVNVILDAKNQSFKLCAVDGVDVVNI